MAKLGFGMMVIMQNEWPKAAADIAPLPRASPARSGHTPPPPIILTNVSVRARAATRRTSAP